MPLATLLALAAGGGRAALAGARCWRPCGEDPAWRAALYGSLAAGVVGALVEDSGPVLLVVAVFTGACVLCYLWGRPRRSPDTPGRRPQHDLGSERLRYTFAERIALPARGGPQSCGGASPRHANELLPRARPADELDRTGGDPQTLGDQPAAAPRWRVRAPARRARARAAAPSRSPTISSAPARGCRRTSISQACTEPPRGPGRQSSSGRLLRMKTGSRPRSPARRSARRRRCSGFCGPGRFFLFGFRPRRRDEERDRHVLGRDPPRSTSAPSSCRI